MSKDPARTTRRIVRISAALAAAFALLALGLWGYSVHQKREMQGAVHELVRQTSVALRATLGADPGDLDARFRALGGHVEALSGMRRSYDPALYQAGEEYLGEAHALLRRQIAVQRSRATLAADMQAIAAHLGAARGRNDEWIREALAKRQKLDKDYFEHRLAAGGLEKSLLAFLDLRPRILPVLTAALLVEDERVIAARKRLLESEEKLAREIEAVRKLPVGR